ncbi:MAG TPA: ABC transporter permease [Ignavibacteria bacterium]
MKLIFHFIKKEFRQFRRDRKMFMTILIAPVIQLIFLGYAATLDVNTVHTAVFDKDRTEKSRELIRSFEKSGYFQIDHYITNYDELTKLLDKGEVLMGLIIPPDFEKNIERKESAEVQTIFDGSDGNKASIAAGYSQGVVSGYSQNIRFNVLEKSGKIIPMSGTIQPEIRVWYNPDMTARNYMLPGIFGLILLIITTNLTSLAIVKEREIGTLEQLLVTPIKPYQMILGKLVPFTILGFASLILVFTVMKLWFNIEIKGNVVYLYFSSFLFMLSTLGGGLFISTISKTQFQAMIISSFIMIMPMIFLSGFTFPIENMPRVVQYMTYLIPLRYFNIIVRGVVLKGLGITDLWQETLALFSIGIAILTFASLRFHKKL